MIHSSHSATGKLGKAFDQGVAAKTDKEPFNPYRIGTKAHDEWKRGFNS